MLFKLSMSGMKSKLKDYIVLLAGLIMSISIFYLFQTLALNKAFIEGNSIIQSIGFIFHAGSFLLVVITFFYILYANSFLLSLRQKEFGMYMMLGAKKYKIKLLMFIETIVLGIISLSMGIVLGIVLAQGIGQLLMNQLDFTGRGYHAFYIPSMTVTITFFLMMFILSAMMNSIKLSRVTVLQLVHSEMQIEHAPIKTKKNIAGSLLACLLLSIGYISMIKMDVLKETGVIIALVATTLGTFLLFISLLPFIIKKLKNHKKLREKGINAFTFAQLSFRINSLTKVLATVAMLVALGAGAIAAGMAFKNNVLLMANGSEIYDVVTHNPTTQEKQILHEITFKQKYQYRYKTDDKYVYYLKEDLEKNRPLVHSQEGRKDFNKFKEISKDLPEGSVLEDGIENGSDSAQIPSEWQEALDSIEPYYAHENHKIKIVDYNMYRKIHGKEGSVFIGNTGDFESYKEELKQLDNIQLHKYKNIDPEQLRSKYSSYEMFYGVSSGTVFMGFFLGIAFLTMMASCLMFKILSGASKDIMRYQMLRKIGVRQELLTKSIYKEIFLIFLFPALIGIAHVLIGMNIFSFILINPYYRVWLPIVIFSIIYVVYYLITVQLFKGIVLPKSIKE
ncbi:ABC transporter permease [Priestia endophytica]|uniref:FtsX-like permease family protein n=1 Tax=Priestia endophytica TaxID=135735 RepID=UPI000DCA90FE|nr:ABC transporter permease [Priestia endophytica]RAS91786.1 ABC transporter permease [Priestia endophytica]